jgi:HEAT repeat protein
VRRGLLAFALAAALSGACEDGSHGDIGDEINILVRRNDQLVPPATERLAAYKRAAIPQIETAFHTAAPAGRVHLITALARIGDGEAVPILRHAALYDVNADVRGAAEAVLTRWATGKDARADRARAALTELARKRAAGEGPLLYGDGGLPGVPSTVGAPDPIGAAPTP